MTDPLPAIAEEDLHALLDDELEPERRETVLRYLPQHPDVAARVADYAAQRDGLRAALKLPADEPVPPSLDLQRLVQERLTRGRARWRVAASLVAASVVGALALGGAAGWALHGEMMAPDSGIALLAREAAANHVVYTADRRRPTELGADQRDDLARWVSNRLNRPITVPDLSGTGFRFLGGRLAATHEGPAGLFMYQSESGVRLTIFVRPVAGPRDAPIRQVDAGGLDGWAWADNGVGYTVIAPVSATELREIAQKVRRLSQGPA